MVKELYDDNASKALANLFSGFPSLNYEITIDKDKDDWSYKRKKI